MAGTSLEKRCSHVVDSSRIVGCLDMRTSSEWGKVVVVVVVFTSVSQHQARHIEKK